MNSISRALARGRPAEHRRRPRDPRHSHRPSRPAAIVARPSLFVVAGIVIGGLTLGTTLAEQPANTVTPDDLAGRAGDFALLDRGQLAPGLAEVRLTFTTAAPPAIGANRVLAFGASGSAAAVASQIGPAPRP